MGKKIKRKNPELVQLLKEQLELLKLNCDIFDAGNEIVGKQIAVILRTLFHDTNNSKSILGQLHFKSCTWISSIEDLNMNNLLAECNFVSLLMKFDNGTGEGKYMPRCKSGFEQTYWKKFINWWNDDVVKDKKGNCFSRKRLILFIANKDGGAHIDDKIDENDVFLITPNSLDWKYDKKGEKEDFIGRPELICMRQIANETLRTIEIKYPKLLEK